MSIIIIAFYCLGMGFKLYKIWKGEYVEEEPVFLSTSSHKSIGFQATNDEDGEKCRDYDEGGGEEKTEERGFRESPYKTGPKLKPNR